MPKSFADAALLPVHRVVAVVYDQLCTFEYSIAVEIFGGKRPRFEGGWYKFQTAAGEAGPLRAQGSLMVAGDGGLELLENAETIIIPGWRGPGHAVPKTLSSALRLAYQKGSRIVSICGGAYILAEAGLLSGRRATTHWHHCKDFAQRYPDVRLEPDVLYVDEGNVLTSAGSAAGIDLCLHIVRRDYGPEAANHMARGLVVPPHRSGSQAQYVQRPVQADDTSRLSPLLDWMRVSLAEDLSLARLSKQANMSQRTFLRRFFEFTGTPPGEWILNERISHACNLLETTMLSIDEVALRSGLGSAPTMRHHFRRRLRSTPTAHRLQFSRSYKGGVEHHDGTTRSYPGIYDSYSAATKAAARSAYIADG